MSIRKASTSHNRLYGSTRRFASVLFSTILVAMLTISCTPVPTVSLTTLEESSDSVEQRTWENDAEYLRLVRRYKGKQTGDLVFRENSMAYLVTPLLERASLVHAGRRTGLSRDEFEARWLNILKLHESFLVFSVDQRLPFYSAWNRAQLLSFLKDNLLITLEGAGDSLLYPTRILFDTKEAFHGLSDADGVLAPTELSVPLRVYFRKSDSIQQVLASEDVTIHLRLRLQEDLPYQIGFWDDQYYQGFKWKLKPGARDAVLSTSK